MKFEAKIRSYGWYCNRCKERKPIDKVWVAKITKDNYVGMICADCNTELLDCFSAKHYYPDIKEKCSECEDRFQCFTKSEAQVMKVMKDTHAHEIHARVPIEATNGKVAGIKSYTGKVYDKLEKGKFCFYPHREDCNNSWMRANYTGQPYRRCRYMKYDKDKKEWYCQHGRSLRDT